MLEVTGDYWQYYQKNPDIVAIVFTSNCILDKNQYLVMGAGIAKSFKEKYPELPKYYGKLIKEYFINYYDNSHCLICDFSRDLNDPLHVVAFPTKKDWKNPSTIDLIIRSASQLQYLTNIHGWEKVLMTRPGCGLGGLEWKDVKVELDRYLDDRFIVINKE